MTKNQVFAARAHHRAAGRVGEHVGVVGPMEVLGEHCAPVRSAVAAPLSASPCSSRGTPCSRPARPTRSARPRSRPRRRGRTTAGRCRRRHRACSGGRPRSILDLHPRSAPRRRNELLHRLPHAQHAGGPAIVAIRAGLVVHHPDAQRGRLRPPPPRRKGPAAAAVTRVRRVIVMKSSRHAAAPRGHFRIPTRVSQTASRM